MCKKSLLMMLLLALLVPWAAKAQSELTVYEGTTTNNVVPAYIFYYDDFTRVQHVIPADDLAEMNGGTITSLKYYTTASNVPYTAVSSARVYLMEVDYTTMTALEPIENGTVVFEGYFDVVSEGEGGSLTIEFATPYTYGGGNLLVGIENTEDYGYKNISFYGTAVDGAAWGGSSSSSLASVTGSVRNFIPQTTFEYTPGGGSICDRPETFEVSNVTAHTATLTWTGGSGVYNVEYKSGDAEDWTAYLSGTTVTTVNLSGLTAETNYQYRVQSVCGSDVSGWKNVSFSTPVACFAPTDLTVTLTPGNGTIANLAWTENGTATEWDIEYGRDANFEDYQIANASGTPSYLLEGLTPEVKYYARVKAFCGDEGYSTYSNVVSFTPTDAYQITVNDGDNTNGYIPVYGWYVDQFSKSQFIIPAADLADMQYGIISKLTFYASQASVDWGAAEFEVYVAEVGYTTFEEATLVDWTTMEKVMNAGSLGISDNKMEVTFDAPYQYLGGNLMIGILQTQNGSYVSSTWYGVTQEGNTAIGGYETSKGLSRYMFLPKTTIAYEPGEAPACPKPTQLAVNYEEGTTATISWTSDASAWNIDVNGTVTAITENPYTLTNLELGTDYEVMVQASCGDATSEWAGPVSFTTDACMPEDMIVVNYELVDSWGDGWNSNYILVVDENCNIVDQLTIASGSSATGTVRVCGSLAQFVWYMGSYPAETSWVFTDANGEVLFEGAGSTDMASYDVLYTIDLNPYSMPADIEAIEVGPYTAKLGWTETGTATAWQIGFFDNEGELVNTVDANTNPFTLTGLTPETDYYVNVRATGANGTSLWPCLGYTSFTTLEGCAAPTALDVTPSVFSAVVDWTDFEGAYDIEWAEVSTAKDGGRWMQYDNGTVATNIGGSSASEQTWGVMYPPTMTQGYTTLSKVAFYVSTYYHTNDITVNIYQGENPITGTLLATQTVTPATTSGMMEVDLDAPLTIDPTQNLWITLTTTGTYVKTASSVTEPNDRWVLSGDEWVDVATLNEALVGYGWMIRGYVEDYDASVFNWTSETGVVPPYTIENLNAETTYMVRVKASCGTAWKWAEFTTHSACDAPAELEATDITYNAATLNWMGYQDSYNVQYREAAKYVPVWEDDFENGIGEDWTNISGEGAEMVSGQTTAWYVINPTGGLSFEAHSGDYCASSWSWNSSAYNANNWLITPQIDLQGILRYYVRTNDGYPDSYEVLLSTTDADTTSFTVTLKEMAPAPANSEWNEVVIDLSAYAGQQGYIAIHHVDYDANYLCIDDFGVYTVVEAGEWIPATATETTLAISGLTPETEYEWQVQGINPSCDGGLTEWSEMATFTTPEQTTVTQTIALASGANWVSFNVDITLDELKDALAEITPNSSITIKGQSSNTVYVPRTHKWNGTLDWDLNRMYIITITTDCEIALEGMPLDPAEHPITIANGANWIGFPLNENMTPTNAFAGFAVNGDVIKSQSNNSVYSRNKWSNGVPELEPGKGYIYVSAATEDRTLVFPASSKTAAPKTVAPKVTVRSFAKLPMTTEMYPAK